MEEITNVHNTIPTIEPNGFGTANHFDDSFGFNPFRGGYPSYYDRGYGRYNQYGYWNNVRNFFGYPTQSWHQPGFASPLAYGHAYPQAWQFGYEPYFSNYAYQPYGYGRGFYGYSQPFSYGPYFGNPWQFSGWNGCNPAWQYGASNWSQPWNYGPYTSGWGSPAFWGFGSFR